MPEHAERVAVIAATSSLAQAVCRTLAERGYALSLCARDAQELALLESDLRVRYGVEVSSLACDFFAPDYHPAALLARLGAFDHLVIALGDMGSGENHEPANIAYVTYVNHTLPAQLAALACEALAEKGGGSVAIIGSVAGDRGRQSNYAYGSAKAALASFASGLRNRYWPRGVHVLTFKPGFTDTPMTWGMKSPLIAPREAVAERLVTAMENRRNVVYAPWFWRVIMGIIQHLPEALFKRLKL